MFENVEDMPETGQPVEDLPQDTPEEPEPVQVDETATGVPESQSENTEDPEQNSEQPEDIPPSTEVKEISAPEETPAPSTTFQEDVLKAIQRCRETQDAALTEVQQITLHQQNIESAAIVSGVGLGVIAGILVALILAIYLRH